MSSAPRPPDPDPSPEASTSPDPAALRRTLRLSLVEGSVVQIFLNWTSGAVLIGYLLHLGAGPGHLGLVASVPLLAQSTGPLAAWVAARLGRRRLPTALAATLGRGLWLLAALLPQLGVPAGLEPALLVALVLVSSLFQAAAGTLWSAWMGDVVPAERRGRYFGLRTGLVGVVGMAANLLAGAFLDRVAAPVSFQLVIGVAVVCAAVGVALYFRHWEPPAAPSRVSFGEVVAAPLRDPDYRRFLRFAAYWQFAVLLAAPFVFPYFLSELRLDFTQVAVWSAIAAVSALVTTSLWGRVADRTGNKAVLAIGTFVAGAGLPLTWILAGLSGDVRWVWLSGVLDAVAWGAIGPALFNLSLATAPAAQRAAYLAMLGLVSGVAGFVGGLLSGPLLTLLQSASFELAGARWSGYHWLFVLSGAARMTAWTLLRPVRESAAWRTRDVLRGAVRYGWRGIGFFWRS